MFAVCRPCFFFELSGFRYLCSLEAKSAENLIFFSPFLWCCANVGVVSREIREPPTYLSSKNKKIPDRIDSRVQPVWRLQVMGSCYNQSVWNAGNQSFSHSFCLKWMSIDIILREICCLLSPCGRGKVKDRSLYILSPREGGRWVPGP